MSSRELIRRLLENERGGAVDNLARARHAASHQDSGKEYGQSGQTLDEIMAGYQKRLDAVEQAQVWFDDH